ncbi:hypothetical protein DH2020_010839 [Rehmannia glutinosa]|uniref:glycerophosphodiester phosphodiesterase n=1 Tax=Rehmannia glutinosa TaxID=99300 RepID=A0ABR0XBU4_REHGL
MDDSKCTWWILWLFPASSQPAYDFALDSSILGTILYCNLHFTKDNEGFCIPQINLQNATTIEEFDPKGAKTYNVNGRDIHGYFVRQNIFTRQGVFDGAPIVGPFQLAEDRNGKPTRLWLNIENDMFYKQHKIIPETFLLEQLNVLPEFISSPEIGFLRSIGPKLGNAKTKLVFTFLEENELEPTTNVTYGSLAKNLTTIKSFASGIVVPKEYIWPVNKARILQPATTIVQDAHKIGLAVYASGFANDNFLSYNYSYDPTREYLQFIDNSQFSVDGVLSDFPSTASEAIGLIISHNGASGDFPGATDLAYQKAVDDGADIIDCSVQMSKDGIAFCSDRADLMKTTTAATLYIDQSTNVPEVQSTDGIFSFDLTWSQIQSLKPQIESFFEGNLVRNPANKNSGKFVTLSEFLELAKTKAVTGVLISIQNAPFLASKGLDIVGTVSAALSNATFDKQSTQKVLIQSDDSSVLLKFKDIPSYQRVTTENLIFDYLSDPYVELTTFNSLQVDGFVTDYPATVNSFVRSTCTTNGSAYLIPPVQPGFLYEADPVAEPPLLSSADVVDPPLPAIAKNDTAQSANDSASTSDAPASAPAPKSSSTTITVSTQGLLFAAMVALLTIFT